MLTSSIISLIIAQSPGHHNLFLFLIGVFTIYLIIAGNNALKLKLTYQDEISWQIRSVPILMMIVSIAMVIIGFYSLIKLEPQNWLYLIFGGFGFLLTWKDFVTFRIFKEQKNAWLKNHLGRMTGALIASITAFIVAGLNIGNILAWITPSVIGTIYIIYWSRILRD